MASKLFSPINLRGLTLKNRIVISPMCQYSAIDGNATDWHLIHLGNLSLSGAGLLMIEATAVNATGRISYGDLGLYSDDNEKSLGRILTSCRRYGNTPIGIQIAHSGRKGSTHLPWKGGAPLTPKEEAWQTVAPSAIARGKNWPIPHELSIEEIDSIKKDFIASTERASRLNIDLIELHVAHGYLLHEFMSPISNTRNDQYGGNLENRMRLPLEIAEAMRSVWPKEKPMGARITGNDWLPGGLIVSDAVIFAKKLKEIGIDYVCVTSTGIVPTSEVKFSAGYQVSFAAEVKRQADIPTQTVGLITTPEQAERIIAESDADMVAIARSFLDDPRWVWHAAQKLGADAAYPPQYFRCRSDVWPEANPKKD